MSKQVELRKHWINPVLSGLIIVFLSACGGGGGGGSTDGDRDPDDGSIDEPLGPPQFVDATVSTGFEFTHGYLLATGSDIEQSGGGVAVGDYDNDGDVDVFF